MDALSELLSTIRLRGTAFIDACLSAPWAFETPAPEELARRMAPDAERVIPYHLVSEGSCIAQWAGGPPLVLAAGEVVVFPFGDVHQLSSDPGLKSTRITTEAVARLTRPGTISRTTFGGGGAETRLICGFFDCNQNLSEHLIRSLPRMFKFRVRQDSAAAFLPAAARNTAGPGPGSHAVLCRLSELLFVDAVRACVDELASGQEGFVGALRDPMVSRALALIHRAPSHPWTLSGIAKAVGASRTSLNEHFLACLGQPPVQYLWAWRLRLAADALTHGDQTLKGIAAEAAFGSTVAFNRAFRREFGLSPGAWRKARQAK